MRKGPSKSKYSKIDCSRTMCNDDETVLKDLSSERELSSLDEFQKPVKFFEIPLQKPSCWSTDQIEEISLTHKNVLPAEVVLGVLHELERLGMAVFSLDRVLDQIDIVNASEASQKTNMFSLAFSNWKGISKNLATNRSPSTVRYLLLI